MEKETKDYKPTTEEEKTINYVKNRIDAMKKARKGWETIWDGAEKLFRGHKKAIKSTDWRSHIFVGRPYGIVMAALSEVSTQKPDIVAIPQGSEDAPKADVAQIIAEYHWKENKGNAVLTYSLLDTLKLGTAILEVKFNKFKDDVDFNLVKLQDFYVDETAQNMDTAKDCAKRMLVDWEEFEENYPNQYKQAKFVQSGGDVQRQEFYSPYITKGTTEKEQVEIYIYYNKVKNLYAILANGVLLTNPEDKIPYTHKELPFARLITSPYDAYTFYGIPLPILIQDSVNEYNTLINMMLDQAHLSIFKAFFVGMGEELDDVDVEMGPGTTIPVRDVTQVKSVDMGSVTPEYFKLLDGIDNDIKQTSGIDLRLQAIPRATATDVAISKEKALKRINTSLRFLEDLDLARFSDLYWKTLQQYYFTSKKNKKLIKILGKEREQKYSEILLPKVVSEVKKRLKPKIYASSGREFLRVEPKDLRGNIDVRLRIGTTISISKELEKKQNKELYAMFAGNPIVDQTKLAAMLLKSHGIDPEDMLVQKATEDRSKVLESIDLAERQNEQLLKGEPVTIVPELITPEHIRIHAELEKSPQIADRPDVQEQIRAHALEEIKIYKQQQGEQGEQSRDETPRPGSGEATERIGGLTKPAASAQGLPKAHVQPETAAALSV